MENLVILLALFVTIGIPIIKCVYDNKKNAEIQELEKIKWETIRNHRKAYEEFSNHLVEVFNELCGIEVEKGIIGFQGGSFLRNLCDRNIVPIYSNPEIVFYYSYAITIYLYFGIEQYLTRNEIKFKRDKVLEGLSILCKNMLSLPEDQLENDMKMMRFFAGYTDNAYLYYQDVVIKEIYKRPLI